jgi:hypothetical protein
VARLAQAATGVPAVLAWLILALLVGLRAVNADHPADDGAFAIFSRDGDLWYNWDFFDPNSPPVNATVDWLVTYISLSGQASIGSRGRWSPSVMSTDASSYLNVVAPCICAS